jgi:uncharacterized phage protein gp47/JayE
MTLSLRQFSDWVQQQAAAVQASAAGILDFTAGSVVRAIMEANASVALWFQWLLVKCLAMTRAATSAGSDLDTWMADFGLARLAAVKATGEVTFARYTTGVAALIVPGVEVRTSGGTAFVVTTDTTHAQWDAGQGGYAVGSAAADITVPVEAAEAGAAGNVSADTISLIGSSIAGVDTVTNDLAFTDGDDAETDDELRDRFAAYINTRSLATVAAVEYAISTVRQGLFYRVVENEDPNGDEHLGHFVVTVDDGTGAPDSDLLDQVYAAVDAVRPVCSTFEVQGPDVVTANVAFTFSAASGYIKATMEPVIETAVSAYINALPMGDALRWSKLFDVIYSATAGVANVTVLTVNSGTADVGGAADQVVRAGTVTAS